MGSAVRPIEELRIIPKRKILGMIYERDTYPEASMGMVDR